MNALESFAAGEAHAEIAALIEVLHKADQRLEELTAGDVDTVADHEGRTVLLRRAQDHLRHHEAIRQAAILDAVPAHIALLDARGVIISVNEAWRRFAGATVLHEPDVGIGENYLEICDSARGEGAVEAHQVAAGLRALLTGRETHVSIEYPCHSPIEQRWFLLTITPLADGSLNGVVVMHFDITARKRAEQALRTSELEFRTLTEAIPQIVWISRPDGWNVYINQRWMDYTGLTLEESLGQGWNKPFHPDDQQRAWQAWQVATTTSSAYSLECRLRRNDGEYRWWLTRGLPLLDADGKVLKWFGTATDIHDLKSAELELLAATQALRESERRFSDMLANVELVSLMLDTNARITYCNDYLLRLTGWRREEVTGRDWFDLFVPPDTTELKEVTAALLADKPEALHHENVILTRWGERRLIRWNNSVLRSGAGEVIGTASIGEDITEQKQAEARIKRLSRVDTVLRHISGLIVRMRNRNELFTEACQVAVEHGHYKMAWIGIVDRSAMKIMLVASAGVEPEFLSLIDDPAAPRGDMPLLGGTKAARAVREKQAIVTNEIVGDSTIIFATERIARGIVSMAVLPLLVAGDAVGVLALYADQSEFFDTGEMQLLHELAGDIAFAIDYIDKQERLDYLAYYDSITGLANRKFFHDRLQQAVVNGSEQQHKLALVLLDIERFKIINDTFGRQTGDSLLKEVAQRMSRYAVDTGRLGRIDSDHFAIMVLDVKAEDDVARLIEQRVGEIFVPPFRIGAAELRVAAKFGIAMFPADGADADTLFRNAEAALLNAKASGERYLFYMQSMNERVAEKLALENRLRQALDKGEFVLHYQPKVDLATGIITGVEALIRWQDPQSGLMPPAQFIPILEETGLIHEVGRWALRQAIEDHLRWRNAGLPALRIAVNVSALQLRNRGFLAEIKEIIGIDARAAAGLELEITESLIMEDVTHSVASLQTIRDLGISIAIDDFGTGYSSLSYLAKLPVDTLKIDRSFVTDMTAGPQGLALVGTIINLAHALKLKVVAEGVETDQQLRQLRLLSCDEMQGYLFSKPLPSELFATKYLAPLPAP